MTKTDCISLAVQNFPLADCVRISPHPANAEPVRSVSKPRQLYQPHHSIWRNCAERPFQISSSEAVKDAASMEPVLPCSMMEQEEKAQKN